MIIHGRKQISEMVYARRASEGGGAVRLTNMIRGPQVVFGGVRPSFKWLTFAAKQAIVGAFGDDGYAVIGATNQYLNVLAASDRDKATALAGFINEDPMMVCSLGLEVPGVAMPIRWLQADNNSHIVLTGFRGGDVDIEVEFQLTTTDNNVCGLWGENANSRLCAFQWSAAFYCNGSQMFNGLATNTTYTWKHIGTSWEMLREGETLKSGTKAKPGNSDTDVKLFCITNVSGTITYPGPHRFARWKAGNVLNLVPYKHPTQGNGMLDLVNVVFYPNAGTGQFTIPDISYTPSTP